MAEDAESAPHLREKLTTDPVTNKPKYDPDVAFKMDWHPPVDQTERGKVLMKKYGINTYQLTNCSMCHY